METATITLGQALAILNDGSKRSAIPDDTMATEHIIRLKKRQNELRSDHRLNPVLSKLPQVICDGNSPFLQNNEDFFLAFFSNPLNEEMCGRLCRHLNSCYGCFEVFTSVLRDYYGQSAEEREQSGD